MKIYLLPMTLALSVSTAYAQSQVDLIINNATILSPTSKHQVKVTSGHWVAISNNRIIKISNNKNKPVAKSVIDGTGKFLTPGLMDSHVHLKTMPGLLRSDKNANKMQHDFLARQGKNYLYYGVTQVIDPSNTQQGIDRFHASGLTPDAYFCGAMPIFNGYNARGFEHKHLHHKRPYYVAQKNDPVTPSDIEHIHQPEMAITRLTADGATCAKVYMENGFDLADHIPMIEMENLKKVTKQAKRLNIPTMAHANATDMQEIAANGGVDIMGHGLWNWLEEHQNQPTEKLPAKVTQVLDSIISKDIAFQPTLNVIRSLKDVMVKGHISLPAYQTVLPQSQIDWYLSDQGQWFANGTLQEWGIPVDSIIKRFESNQLNGQRALNYLYNNGGTILLGSDTPPAPTYAAQPGLSTYWELLEMHKSGVDLVGLLAAATLNTAKAYNLEKDYGSITEGKIANLLLLNSNPLSKVSAYDDIDTIVLQGKLINRSSLHINQH